MLHAAIHRTVANLKCMVISTEEKFRKKLICSSERQVSINVPIYKICIKYVKFTFNRFSMIDKNKIYSIEGECMRNDTIELLLKEDGVYSLIPGDEELSYHNGEVINS